jgi:hypothetical protein
VRLEVSDDHPHRPRVVADGDVDAESGRGLLLVEPAVAGVAGGMEVLPLPVGKTGRGMRGGTGAA